MEYIVSARKYRPLTFDTVVGQQTLTTTLKNAVKSSKLAHAYLFCGPRGVGKTTCARIFARAINCLTPTAEGEACGQCESCRSFEEQRSYNIFELDAASNNSVEDIKQLMDQTRIPPQVGRYKVFIIDEVHMLSTAAFNAFLKTLEEPPAHVIFILATTEKHKLLPTIISRCQIYDFERMTVQNTIDHLKMVAEREGYTYEEQALAVIAEKADGGMRDALSIFDQAASYCQGNITYERVIEDLNVLDAENYFRIVELSLENKVADVMLLLNNVIAKGFDGGNLCQGLAAHIRNVMMAKDPQTVQLLEVSAQQKARYAEQAKKCPAVFLYNALKLLNQCDLGYRQSSNKRLLVELTLIQVAQITQPEEQVPGSGLCPNRLKSLFKQIVLKPQSKKAAQQVAATVSRSAETSQKEAAYSVPQPKDTVAEQPNTNQPAQKKPALKLSNLGFTFAAKKQDGQQNVAQENQTDDTQKKEQLPCAAFNQEDAEREWLRMCNRMQLVPEMKGLANRMKNIYPLVKECPQIEIVIENSMLMDEVKKIEGRILKTLQKSLDNSLITILTRLAEPKEIKKRLSKQEIVAEMKKSNSAMKVLFSRLSLELN